MGTNPRTFWNEKILTWERDRYDTAQGSGSLLERIAGSVSGLPVRLANARRILLPHVDGKRVVELGCGSGLLAEVVVGAGATSYRGIDIADSAVALARERVAKTPHAERISFEAGDVRSFASGFEADVVFSLGLLDWLEEDELDVVFRLSAGRTFLHSFSERTRSPWRFLHKAYVWIAYGHRTGGYAPRYDTVEELTAILRRWDDEPVQAFRDPAMRFACFLTNLPLPSELPKRRS